MEDDGDHERLLGDLIESGVFEESPDGSLQPAESFQSRRQEHRTEVAELDGPELDEARSAYTASADPDPSVVGVETLGDARAIYNTAASLGRERALLAALALERMEKSESLGGVPEGFVPLEGAEVDGFMESHPVAILYFWREECEPCDAVRESLEALVANGEIPEAVGLGAVYGPDAAELVRDRYQVAVAPTTLFCVDGRIDSRILGAHAYEAIRTEIRTITDLMD